MWEGLDHGERFWLSDPQWAAIAPLLPHLGGKPRGDDRRVISGILHSFREGFAGGRSLRSTGRARHCSTASTGGASAGCGRSSSPPWRPATIRPWWRWWTALRCGRIAPRQGQKGEQGQAIGRSRGGRTTKIHALADQDGRLYALLLTPGQTHDIRGARPLLASVAAPSCLVGDKAYDANDLRRFLAAQGTEIVISPMPTRTNRPAFDPIAYRQRNIIERAFCRLKDWRAIATRYDKTARNSLAGICLAGAITWWIR